MSRLKGNLTVATLAHSSSESLRTTIPAHVVRQLGLGSRDHLDWRIDKVGDEWVVVVRRAARP